MPCVFTWPTALPITRAPHVPTITYPPRGLGRLWESQQDTTDSPLAELVGRTRAAIVSHLDLPMSTTHLAHQLGVSAPTLSVHLSILRNAGVVASRRDGRAVLYSRTPSATTCSPPPPRRLPSRRPVPPPRLCQPDL